MDEQISVPTKKPEKPSPLLTILLTALIVLLLGGIIFLGYQNIQLTKQVAVYKAVINTTPTPSPTPIVVYPTPVQTGNTKTYLRSNCGSYPEKYPFSVDIPSHWSESINDSKENYYSTYTYSDGVSTFSVTCGTGFGGGGCGVMNPSIQNNFIINGQPVKGCMEQSKNAITLRLTYVDVIEDRNYPSFSFEAMTNDLVKGKSVINQLLSTFKFLGQSTMVPSPTYTCPPSGYVDCMPVLTPEKQVACSAEAMAWYETNCTGFKGGAL